VNRINPNKNVPVRGEIAGDTTDPRAKRVRVLAKLLDNSITVPGTGWKIGLDPIVGLIPGIGDLVGAALSGYIVLEAARAEASAFTLARMVANVGIDTLLGAVPALGDVSMPPGSRTPGTCSFSSGISRPGSLWPADESGVALRWLRSSWWRW